ncbi:hypothetical protein MNBD_PLANCTO03-1001, partial [hydrothermal vent metagenome]
MTHMLVIVLMVVAAVRELGPRELVLGAWIEAHPVWAAV